MPKKNKIVVTGGAGFVGTNLIKILLKKTRYKIISIDNYSSGRKSNHIKDSRVKYLKGKTVDISKLIKNPKEIKTVFHFGEFARIYQSFLKMSECIDSNSVGSNAVFNFCLKSKIKLIYSATSASLGNYGNDKNLKQHLFQWNSTRYTCPFVKSFDKFLQTHQNEKSSEFVLDLTLMRYFLCGL